MSWAATRWKSARPISTGRRGATSPPITRRSRTMSSPVVDELEESADYQARRRAVLDHNAAGGILRRGIALTPVKFGISFTATHFNQAGRAGACLQRRLDPPQPWRHRNGPGAEYQGRAGGGGCLSGRYRPDQDHRHQHRKRCPTPRRQPPHPGRTSTAWRRWTPPTRSRRGWWISPPSAGRRHRRMCASSPAACKSATR